MSEEEYNTALGRILEYCSSRGISVNLNSNAFTYCEEEDAITCAIKSHNTTSMIVGLLHEAGHTVNISTAFSNMSNTTKWKYIYTLEQEYLAWQEGWNIALTLNIANTSLWKEYQKNWMNSWSKYILEYTKQYAQSRGMDI